MGKATERDIVAFAVDFVKKVKEIDKRILGDCYSEYVFRWSNKKISLNDIHEGDLTVDDVLEKCEVAEETVSEFTDDDECVAYLAAEGELYEMMYYFEAYGRGGKKAKVILKAARMAANNNGLYFEWGGGSLKFFDIYEFNMKIQNITMSF